MKVFQIRDNRPQQILVLPMIVIKGVHGIIRAIQHAFVWRIIYDQCVPNVSLRISKKVKCRGSCGKLAC